MPSVIGYRSLSCTKESVINNKIVTTRSKEIFIIRKAGIKIKSKNRIKKNPKNRQSRQWIESWIRVKRTTVVLHCGNRYTSNTSYINYVTTKWLIKFFDGLQAMNKTRFHCGFSNKLLSFLLSWFYYSSSQLYKETFKNS